MPQLTFYSSDQHDPIVSIFATNGGGGMIFSGIDGTTKAILETTNDGAVLNLVDGDKGRAHSGMGSFDYRRAEANSHKSIAAAIVMRASSTCLPTSPDNPVDGNLLQVMPWPTFSHMSDRDIEAIYEYLRAIPCIDNTTSTPPDGAPNELRNDCGTGGAVANDAVKDSRTQQAPRSRRRR